MKSNKQYWHDRNLDTMKALSDKTIEETEKQLIKYYQKTMESVVADFEATYNKLLTTIGNDKQPTPADLYKLDKYWQMQSQLNAKLQKLGDKQLELFNKKFVEQYKGVYESLALTGAPAHTTMDEKVAKQVINHIWCADGKSWSDRIWTNTSRLQEMLNEKLIDCVVGGKKTTDLKKSLREEFNTNYYCADRIARTEISHLQNQAQKRYEDYGIQYVEVWADEDERRCKVCGKLHQKKFPINATLPVPAHPNCRCTIVPVVEDEVTLPITDKTKDTDKNNDKALAAVNKTTLTQEVKNDTLTEPAVQRAQQKVKELQQKEGNLTVYDKDSQSHKKHVKDMLGVEEVDEAAWAEYEKLATEFLKKDIDGKEMDGFLSANGTLFKFERSTGKFAILSKEGTISTFFIPDRKKPKDYWKDQLDKFKPKE